MTYFSFHTRLVRWEVDAPLWGKSNASSTASERASPSGQWADTGANLLWALFSFLKRPQRHEKSLLQPVLWSAPNELTTPLPGSHKQPGCPSESTLPAFTAPPVTCHGVRSSYCAGWKREGRGGWQGRKCGEHWTKQGSIKDKFLNLPNFHYQVF